MPDFQTRAEEIAFIRQGMSKSAIVQSYTIAGQTTTFRSLDEQRRHFAWLQELEAAEAGRSRSRLATTRKGV
jgi:hypothetical protein